MEKDLYELELHDISNLPNWIDVMRVPGGWIYIFKDPSTNKENNTTFVPFNNEFQKSDDSKYNDEIPF